ncbi:MAG: class D sortase [Oscillospiraceae bacterium]|nr:class D sortase [Oscillospiraceae bacterium]
MKKLFTIITALILAVATTIPVMAATYDFGGADPGAFGKPTSVEPAIVVGGPADESSNINRSKDSTIIPPPFGSPASNTPNAGELLTPYITGVTISNSSDYGSPAVINNGTGNGTPYYSESSVEPDMIPPTNITYSSNESASSNKFTLPDGMFYADDSIGTLSIPKLNVTGKVYEDESLESLSKGIGHFKSTSCWDGNVGFASHNRGISIAFGQIHTLTTDDKIIYTTEMGTRTYEVYSVSQIQETDMSKLQRTSDNIVTLITCVNDIPLLRWCVQARKIGY